MNSTRTRPLKSRRPEGGRRDVVSRRGGWPRKPERVNESELVNWGYNSAKQLWKTVFDKCFVIRSTTRSPFTNILRQWFGQPEGKNVQTPQASQGFEPMDAFETQEDMQSQALWSVALSNGLSMVGLTTRKAIQDNLR